MSDLTNNEKSNAFFDNIAKTIEEARRIAGRTVNLAMCVTYYEVGRQIVEEEQGGQTRAAYGKKLLSELSKYLNDRFGKGFSETNLRNARKFYQTYSKSIQQTISAELDNGVQPRIQQTVSAEFEQPFLDSVLSNRNAPSIRQMILAESYPFKLSWSHYLILMRIKNKDERRFYETEAVKQNWTYQWLQRQYGSSL